ncbi:MAG: ABC transporter substrate-binding protein [Acholeplasmatales bacterium]|nr:MAG: ABC transporter substrate-binding protein [Acholeplasmatales bacterium]
MKKIIMSFMLVFSIALLAACSGDDNGNGNGQVTAITFWNIFTGPDGQEMVAMINDFNAQHEGEIRVLTQTIPSADFYEVMNTAVPQGQGPDVAIMHLDNIQRYASLSMLDHFDDLLASADFDAEDYIPAVWNAGLYDGRRYGIPLDVHPIGMFYNIDVLAAANVEVPTTTAELIAACDALAAHVTHCLPLSAMWPSQTLFTASLFQNNGVDLDENGEYPAFNTPEGFAALKIFNDLIYTHGVSIPNVGVDEDLAFFRQGNAAFHINGIWMLNGIIESGVNFGTAPIAQLFGDTPATWAGSHQFVMPRGRNINPEKQAAILTFIEFITSNSLRWANAGQIPANLRVLESAEFQALPYHGTFVDVSTIRFVNASPYFDDAFTPIYSRVTAAMTSPGANIQALLDAAELEGIQRVDDALGN